LININDVSVPDKCDHTTVSWQAQVRGVCCTDVTARFESSKGIHPRYDYSA